LNPTLAIALRIENSQPWCLEQGPIRTLVYRSIESKHYT